MNCIFHMDYRSMEKSILANLEEYCKQDTWSLHLVLGKLKELTGS